MENTENQANPNSNFGIPNKDFEPIKKSSNNTPLIVALLLLIIVGTGLFYILYWRPKSETAQKSQEITTTKEENGNQEEDTVEQETVEEEPVPKPVEKKAGSVTQLTEPQNRYHIIIGSYIDEDLANELAKKLAAKGVEVGIIERDIWHLVSVDNASTREEAKELQEMLRSTYKDIRIVKY